MKNLQNELVTCVIIESLVSMSTFKCYRMCGIVINCKIHKLTLQMADPKSHKRGAYVILTQETILIVS